MGKAPFQALFSATSAPARAKLDLSPRPPPGAGGEASSRVLTRAVVRSLPGPAEPITLRLKVLPRGKLPFTTIAFGLARPELAQGIQVGDEVGFVAERTEAGNTIVRLRKLAPCVRFQPCPVVRDD